MTTELLKVSIVTGCTTKDPQKNPMILETVTYSQEASGGADVNNTHTCGRFVEHWKKLLCQINCSKVIDAQAIHSCVICMA